MCIIIKCMLLTLINADYNEKRTSFDALFTDWTERFRSSGFLLHKGRGCVKEKPQGELPHSGKRRHPGVFAGFSFALSEADNPPADGGCCKQPLAPNKRGHLSMSSFVWCGRWDLNPYVCDTRPSNVPVCLFQHYRIFNCLSLSLSDEIHFSKELINCQCFF